MNKGLRAIAAVAVVTIGLLAILGISHAQYPSPAGGLTLETEFVNTPPGGETLLTCTVFEDDGTPIEGAPCTFSILSEPGDDAAVGSKVVTKVTDANGVATTVLKVGSTPGVIVVQAESQGFVSQVVVSAGDEALPPQAPVDGITPPSTGSGGLLGQ